MVPLGFDTSRFSGNQVLIIAIGNFTYLATIGDFIKYRAEQAQIEVQFIEKSPIEIQSLLDHAAGGN